MICLSSLTGCTTEHTVTVPETKLVVLTPDKIAVPAKPELLKYDTRYGLDHPTNFRRFQTNQIVLIDYITNLQNVIATYESEIDNLQKQK